MHKLLTIGANTLQGFTNPVCNFLIIVFGIKTFGKENWGSFITVMIWVLFTTFILSWGNRDYLLRKFSKSPARIYYNFYSNLFTRGLLLPITLVFFYFFSFATSVWACLLVIVIFIHSALDTLVIYKQKFLLQFTTDVIAYSIIFIAIFIIEDFQKVIFLKIYTLAFAIKTILLSFFVGLWKNKIKFSVTNKELKKGFPFFLLGLSGWLISKTDIYFVDIYLSNKQLSEYQLFITSFLMLQALAAYFVIPFTKHIYRLNQKSLNKIQKLLYSIAIPVTVFGSCIIWVILEYFASLNFGFIYYLLGSLFVLPCFFYTLDIMKLIKQHKEKKIIIISILSFLLSASLIFILIESYEILGVIISVCITQWVALFAYKFVS